MLGIPAYLYRLVPANPILLRVVSIGGKRRRDLIVRCGYLGMLIFLVIFALVAGDIGGGDLDQLSRTSTDIFVGMSYLQLALVALLAPIFTAGAITQEKDSQTYDILLATPLTNGQILLGTLLSRLFFVFALLLSGIPVFSITQIFGGVAIGDILVSFLIAAVTALLTGALAVAIATFKVGTRRTIFSFYMVIVTFLVGIYLLDYLPAFRALVYNPATGEFDALSQTGWLSGLHPFLALQSILDPVNYAPPNLADLPPHLRGWPIGWYLTSPASFYITAGAILSLLLVAPSVALLRRMAQSNVSFRGWLVSKLVQLPLLRVAGNRPPRSVWNNPIAWREAKTKASATRAGLLRYVFIFAGLAGAIIICVLYATEAETPRRYITANSWNEPADTLTIHGERADSFALAHNVRVTIEGQEARREALRGRWAVRGETYDVVGGVRTITSIDLRPIPRRLDPGPARQFLLGMVFLEVAVILLIVTNAAASTVTREREDGTLDLLLATPITSHYYIWGKLRGLVSFALPLIVVPVLSCAVFIVYDILSLVTRRGDMQWLVLPEALVLMPALLVIVVAFASIVGMKFSLRQKTTVRAVMISLAIVVGLFALLGWCGYQLASGTAGEIGLAFAAFSPLTVILLMIDPVSFGGRMFLWGQTEAAAGRIVIAIFSTAACAAYAGVIWAMYKAMVKNFDMTIRQQQR